MDSVDGYSVDDLCVSSDGESINIEILVRCIERELAEPIEFPSAGTS